MKKIVSIGGHFVTYQVLEKFKIDIAVPFY